MSGFCPACGLQLDHALRCPDASRHDQLARTGRLAKIELPPASRRRRLFGAGIEFVAYCVGIVVVFIVSPLTGGIGDALVAIPLLVLISIRDAHSGLLSIEKRFAHLRVVKWGSGHPISNTDAFKRNSYYLLLVALMLFPILPLDLLAASLFKMLLVLDLLMILVRKDGRRLGDLLAGTQVVAEARGTTA